MPALIELSMDECERLLRRGTFGRVVLSAPDGNHILPVNYAVHEAAVVVRISAEGILARYAHGAELLFEVDFLDAERWNGWSVVARGRGQVKPAGLEDGPVAVAVRPWAEGDRRCELRLTWHELRGRKVGAGWDAEAAMYSRRVGE